MITTCTECQARYQLDDEKIPRRKIRVRCPACSGVFALDGTQAASASIDPMPAVESVVEAPEDQGLANDDLVISSGFENSFTQDNTPQPAPAAETVAETAQSSVAVLDKAEAAPSSGRRRRSKEEMMARALVSDILVYNRDQRDAALAEGNLLEALGGEIKKSWELYKEKVTPEVANSTNHFRDALNEILAEGDKVF
jgi:predicted Zn finger-like uncharacterized protein